MTFRTEGYGDVVLFKGDDTESGFIIPFLEKTGNSPPPFVHSALRTRKYRAESVGLRGYKVYNLKHPPDWCYEFVILRHKDMTSYKRKELRKFNRELSRKYGLRLILKLALNHFIPQYSISEDLSTENEYSCTSRIASMHNKLELLIMKGVHYSQINPSHFIEGGHFDIVRRWKRTY